MQFENKARKTKLYNPRKKLKNVNDKVYHLEVTQHKYHDGWREGGHYTEVTRIPASGGVPEGELKNLVRKFISDEVNKPDCGLVFNAKHASTLSENWDGECCSAEELARIWNMAQPNMKVEIIAEGSYPPFPINMRIAKGWKGRHCWSVRASDDGGRTWETLLTSDNPEVAQEICFSGKNTNPHKLFSLVFTRIGETT